MSAVRVKFHGDQFQSYSMLLKLFQMYSILVKMFQKYSMASM